jgi:hypothetical protein
MLKTTFTTVGVLLATSLALGTQASAAPNASTSQAQQRDDRARTAFGKRCGTHNTLTGRSSKRELRSAVRGLRRVKLHRTACGLAVESQYAATSGTARSADPRTLEKHCIANAGGLSRHFDARSLRTAYLALSPELRTETNCASSIASQYNLVRGTNAKPLTAPLRRAKLTDVPDLPPTETTQWLVPYVAAFARPADPAPAWVSREFGTATSEARVVGRGDDLVVVPIAGGYCTAFRIGDIVATGQGCANETFARNGFAAVRAPGGWKIFGLTAPGQHDVRVLSEHGTWHDEPIVRDAIEFTTRELPRMITLQTADNVVHYQSFDF